MQPQYDYIISGGGCAGLSLLQHLMNDAFFNDKKILVIDASHKTTNDRTWCFWEKQPGIFEPIIHHKWTQIDFYSNHFSSRYNIEPYVYKMICGIDFYNFVKNNAAEKSNITFINTDVKSIENNTGFATVKTDLGNFTATYIFNSIVFQQPVVTNKSLYLLQHFKGWKIKTDQPVFNSNVATFMDFRVAQQNAATFMYVMPTSENTALVEYTLFSKKILQPQEYDEAIKSYLAKYITTNFTVKETEFGVIPMTNLLFTTDETNIINIGTAGNQTKASSGYTFQFIQKHSRQIVMALRQNKDPHVASSSKKFKYYDSVLLNVLHNNTKPADEIFAAIFKANHPKILFEFLDNESNWTKDFKIINAIKSWAFVKAGLKQLF